LFEQIKKPILMFYFVDVILPIPIEKLFTYKITQHEATFLKPGMRVAVPFGKSKIYTTLVNAVHSHAIQTDEAKEIHQKLVEVSIVLPEQLKLWQWIAVYYLCTMGDVTRAALPGVFLLESETIIKRSLKTSIDDARLKDDEFLVDEALHHQSSLS